MTGMEDIQKNIERLKWKWAAQAARYQVSA